MEISSAFLEPEWNILMEILITPGDLNKNETITMFTKSYNKIEHTNVMLKYTIDNHTWNLVYEWKVCDDNFLLYKFIDICTLIFQEEKLSVIVVFLNQFILLSNYQSYILYLGYSHLILQKNYCDVWFSICK